MSPVTQNLEENIMSTWPVRQLGGLPITVADRDEIADAFVEWALAAREKDARPFYSTSANGQVMAMCAEDNDLLDDFLFADQIVADGMPMVIYSKFFGANKLPERVATTDLFHDVAAIAAERGASYYMFGADEISNLVATQKTQERYPELKIAGRRNGYFSKDEEADIVAEINDLKPDVLWVSMGVPREQRFIREHIDSLKNVGVIKTSGGLFDFLSERNSRAPNWMQSLGFEWAYRAVQEPRRLGPRYLLTNPQALKLLFTRSQ